MEWYKNGNGGNGDATLDMTTVVMALSMQCSAVWGDVKDHSGSKIAALLVEVVEGKGYGNNCFSELKAMSHQKQRITPSSPYETTSPV